MSNPNFDYAVEVDKIWKELESKREFGLKKYGAISFQSSLENLNNCDLFQHAEEELIDTINYSMAQIIKLRLLKKRIEDESK